MVENKPDGLKSTPPVADAHVAIMADFKSPYTALTEALNDADVPSVASRRRMAMAGAQFGGDAVISKTQEAKEALLNRVQDADAAEAGFSEHMWNNVVGVTTVAAGIAKIEKRTATKDYNIHSINFAHTSEGFHKIESGAVKNSFLARFRGHLNIPADGKYTFYVDSDDGAILYVNGMEVVNNDGIHDGMVLKKATVDLKAGEAPVVVDYFCGDTGKCGLTVDWEGGGRKRGPLDATSVVEMQPYKDGELQSLVEIGETMDEATVTSLDA